MRTFLAILLSVATSHAVQLSWDALNHPEVVGYILHFGPDPVFPSQHLPIGKVTTTVVNGLPIGSTIYFVCAARTAANVESGPSNQVAYLVPMPDHPPPGPNPAVVIVDPIITLDEVVTAIVSNGPGNTGDWAGLFEVSASSNEAALLDWNYLNDSRVRPQDGFSAAVVTLTPPGTGVYNVRFFADDNFMELARSQSVTVVELPPPPPPPTGHTHPISEIIGLQQAIDALREEINGKAPLLHTHSAAAPAQTGH